MAFSVENLVSAFKAFTEEIGKNREYLTDLDAKIGDGDHGSNMARGTKAALEKLEAAEPKTYAEFGKTVGMGLVSSVGGASGPLYGTFFLRFGAAGGDAEELDLAGFAKAFRAGVEGVVARGKAQAGDKTMLDALFPAADALDAGSDLDSALKKAKEAAQAGRDATEPMIAHKGRASYLGERSAGTIDPGSASATMLVSALASA